LYKKEGNGQHPPDFRRGGRTVERERGLKRDYIISGGEMNFFQAGEENLATNQPTCRGGRVHWKERLPL